MQQSNKIHTTFDSSFIHFYCLPEEIFCFNMVTCHRSLHTLSGVGDIACCHNFVTKKESTMTMPS
jgi:hypothetical protein